MGFDSMRSTKRALILGWLIAAAAAGLFGQEQAEGELQLHAHELRYQTVREAAALVYPLLSEDGTLDVQKEANTLVIRERPEYLERIVRLLRDFDHPALPLELDVQIVRAGPESSAQVAGARSATPLPVELGNRLRELFRYESYVVQAGAALETLEGEVVTMDLADLYGLRLKVGPVISRRNIKLQGFRLVRRADGEDVAELIHTNLNLELDEPFILGLSRTEASPDALMVVITCRLQGDRRAQKAN